MNHENEQITDAKYKTLIDNILHVNADKIIIFQAWDNSIGHLDRENQIYLCLLETDCDYEIVEGRISLIQYSSVWGEYDEFYFTCEKKIGFEHLFDALVQYHIMSEFGACVFYETCGANNNKIPDADYVMSNINVLDYTPEEYYFIIWKFNKCNLHHINMLYASIIIQTYKHVIDL